MNKLSAGQIDKLITLVSRAPCLFDRNHQHYKEINKKNEAWAEISELIGVDEKFCRTAWRSLKDQFIRSQKLGDKNGVKRPYKYYRRLLFLSNNGESCLESDLDDTSQYFSPGSTSPFSKSASSDFKRNFSQTSSIFAEEESVNSESSFEWPLEPSPKQQCKEEDVEEADIFDDLPTDSVEIRETIEPILHDNIDTFFSFMAGMVRSFNLSPVELATFQSKLCSYATQELTKIQSN